MSGTTRAVVLGGGGSTGVAWHVGVTAGLFDGGVDVRTADAIIGTSAGAMVGSRLASGQDFDAMVADIHARTNGTLELEAMMALDAEASLGILDTWSKMPDDTPVSVAHIGSLALGAQTMALPRFTELIDAEVADVWPTTRFVAVAVDAERGETVLLDASSGVSLAEAVAASVCVPGVFPPVPVAGRRLIDGGIRSGTNADVALGHDRVLVLAPIGSLADALDSAARRAADAEVAALEAAGAQVTILFPDDGANAAIGSNRMDPSIGPVVLAEGRRQGRALAERLVTHW
jgi:NTE family protein